MSNGNTFVPGKAWWVVLIVYLIVFGVACYFTFFMPGYNPAHADPEKLGAMTKISPEVNKFVLDTLKGDADTFHKTHELARSAFNIILGGLIGFLSASGTQLLGKQ